jgi:hypothetical protein
LQFQNAALQTVDRRAEHRIRHWRDSGADRRTAIGVTDHSRGAPECEWRQVRIALRWALIGENCRQTIGGIKRCNYPRKIVIELELVIRKSTAAVNTD